MVISYQTSIPLVPPGFLEDHEEVKNAERMQRAILRHQKKAHAIAQRERNAFRQKERQPKIKAKEEEENKLADAAKRGFSFLAIALENVFSA